MPTLQDAKARPELPARTGRPKEHDLMRLVRKRKAHAFCFVDDGETPNNPSLPVLLYRSPLRLRADLDPAAIFEDLFATHGWKKSWRNGIYDFLHFHTRTHEVLGIARGTAHVQFGGPKGKRIDLRAGDVVVLPAGTGHRRIRSSRDLLVVGAYPKSSGKYDEPKPSKVDHAEAVRSIAAVKGPPSDPVYGAKGPLCHLWR